MWATGTAGRRSSRKKVSNVGSDAEDFLEACRDLEEAERQVKGISQRLKDIVDKLDNNNWTRGPSD